MKIKDIIKKVEEAERKLYSELVDKYQDPQYDNLSEKEKEELIDREVYSKAGSSGAVERAIEALFKEGDDEYYDPFNEAKYQLSNVWIAGEEEEREEYSKAEEKLLEIIDKLEDIASDCETPVEKYEKLFKFCEKCGIEDLAAEYKSLHKRAVEHTKNVEKENMKVNILAVKLNEALDALNSGDVQGAKKLVEKIKEKIETLDRGLISEIEILDNIENRLDTIDEEIAEKSENLSIESKIEKVKHLIANEKFTEAEKLLETLEDLGVAEAEKLLDLVYELKSSKRSFSYDKEELYQIYKDICIDNGYEDIAAMFDIKPSVGINPGKK